jgi:hypothetical protein
MRVENSNSCVKTLILVPLFLCFIHPFQFY